jgi:protein-S-isoprenylcysteine O-methyltransferase Ste14
MKASAVIFRFRMIIMTGIIGVGFWAPWVQFPTTGSRIPLLEWLPLELSRFGLLSYATATAVVIVTGAVIAAIGGFLRIWASAWLGPGIVLHGKMQGASLLADGPYRHVRNPLYLGLLCVFAALALLMPPTGALFTLVAASAFQLCLIFGEEAFLTEQIGEPYLAYMRSVPRLVPRLRNAPRSTGNKPHCLQAVLSEITPIGVFATTAFLSWNYDVGLMERAILVSFGLSLVARAFIPGIKQGSALPQ